MALCQACGTETRWVEVDGERIALDRVPSVNGKYVLDPEDVSKATRVDAPGLDKLGYSAHEDTCPARVRDRERRERKL